MAGAERAAGLDDQDEAVARGRDLPRRRHEQRVADRHRAKVLAPRSGPVGVGDRRQSRAGPDAEAEGAQRLEIGVDARGEDVGAGGDGKERAEPGRPVGRRFFDHADGALLPEEVRQSLEGLFAGVHHDLDVGGVAGDRGHPSNFFMRSKNDVASGPRSLEAASNASSASRCLVFSLAGTSSTRR